MERFYLTLDDASFFHYFRRQLVLLDYKIRWMVAILLREVSAVDDTGADWFGHAQCPAGIPGEIDPWPLFGLFFFVFTGGFQRCLPGNRHAGELCLSWHASLVPSLSIYLQPDMLSPVCLAEGKRA